MPLCHCPTSITTFTHAWKWTAMAPDPSCLLDVNSSIRLTYYRITSCPMAHPMARLQSFRPKVCPMARRPSSLPTICPIARRQFSRHTVRRMPRRPPSHHTVNRLVTATALSHPESPTRRTHIDPTNSPVDVVLGQTAPRHHVDTNVVKMTTAIFEGAAAAAAITVTAATSVPVTDIWASSTTRNPTEADLQFDRVTEASFANKLRGIDTLRGLDDEAFLLKMPGPRRVHGQYGLPAHSDIGRVESTGLVSNLTMSRLDRNTIQGDPPPIGMGTSLDSSKPAPFRLGFCRISDYLTV
jgi:hypothetical protein